MMSQSAVKAQGKVEEVGMFIVTAFVFSSNHYVGQGPASQEAAQHLPADGK